MGFIRFTFNPEDSRRPQRLRQSPEGEWVRFDAAQAEIARLTAELERCKAGPTTRGLDMTTQINAEDFYDYVEAEKEGWFISYAPGNLDETIWRLERRDANPVFLGGDPEAHTHVVKRALEGSKLHQDALDFLRTYEPREYEIVLRHAKETPTTMKDRQSLGRVLRQPIRGEVVMQRYEDTVSRVDTGIGSFTEYRMKKSEQGSYVCYSDAQTEIARLTAELENIREDYAESLGRAEMLTFKLVDTEVERDQALAEVERVKGLLKNLSEIAILHLKWRDQALAQAAAAALEMRERAERDCRGWDDLECDPSINLISNSIRALPIDPDAQKALDQLLAKAREDAIREAAALCAPKKAKVTRGNRFTPSVTNPQSAAAQAARKQCQDSILALLTDGG